jgi:hypothetical protein
MADEGELLSLCPDLCYIHPIRTGKFNGGFPGPNAVRRSPRTLRFRGPGDGFTGPAMKRMV